MTTSEATQPHNALVVLGNPLANRGTAFTLEQRRALGLDGLLPTAVETLDQQVARAYGAFSRYTDDLGKHIYVRQLQDTNEVLFYRLLVDHVEELLPIVYTPTVGQACDAVQSHLPAQPGPVPLLRFATACPSCWPAAPGRRRRDRRDRWRADPRAR
jgi:hypothetical protein